MIFIVPPNEPDYYIVPWWRSWGPFHERKTGRRSWIWRNWTTRASRMRVWPVGNRCTDRKVCTYFPSNRFLYARTPIFSSTSTLRWICDSEVFFSRFNQSINRTIIQSINQSFNHTINQSIIQSINESFNLWKFHFCFLNFDQGKGGGRAMEPPLKKPRRELLLEERAALFALAGDYMET